MSKRIVQTAGKQRLGEFAPIDFLAIEVAGEDTSVEWLEPLSDEEYSNLK